MKQKNTQDQLSSYMNNRISRVSGTDVGYIPDTRENSGIYPKPEKTRVYTRHPYPTPEKIWVYTSRIFFNLYVILIKHFLKFLFIFSF